ncbi:lysophospholipase L1-like esterase [Pseudoduganella flava]|uniref:Lysophospholipase L1-like esterase n=2 Tax=Pseudoduganella flava TaxID=871742 RepID=A0A562PER4_9BURK|nr:GDSL-type esterase/lipase family protein [Pseudoduganella flava]TWI42924.1 lysophospholipase L1-like esterase [Pseudoduganella flava]
MNKKTMLLAGLMLAGAMAQAAPRECALNVEPRTVEYPWMSIARWNQMNDALKARSAQADVDVLFLGDSITEMWDKGAWDSHFGKYRAANFGIGGDHTGNVLWRLKNDGMDKLRPKAVVLLIGVNNFGLCGERPEQVAQGVKAVVAQLRQLYPDTKILLNGILPFKQSAQDPARADVKAVNREIAKLDDGSHVFFRDYGARFLQPNGDIAKETMPDFLHLTPQAYNVWAEALAPDIEKLVR